MRGQPIKCRCFVPDGNGGFRLYDELTADEKDAFGRKLVERMGKEINDYASIHPEAIPRIIAAGTLKAEL